MIEFKTGRKQAMPLIFANVEFEQFFVDEHGFLSQRVDVDRYLIIADPVGVPHSNIVEDVQLDRDVQRILPRVTKISFPGMEQ